MAKAHRQGRLRPVILHVIDSFASDHFAVLAEQLRDVDLHICTIGPQRSLAVERVRAAGGTVHELASAGRSVTIPLRLATLLRRLRPDVVHGHGSVPTVLAIGLSIVAGRPARVHARHHGTTHHVRRLAHRRLLDQLASAIVDRVVVPSSWLAGVVEAEGTPREKIVLIPFGVKHLPMLGANRCRSRPLLVCVGRLHPEKGQDVLLHAIARLEQQVCVQLVGSGPSEDALRSLARDLAIDMAVEFLGFRLDARSLLSTADLVIVPSRSETFSQVAIEAAVAAVPLVVTDAGALPEVVPEGVTVVPAGDPEALRSAIATVLSDLEASRSRAEAIASDARQRYEPTVMSAAFNRLYHGLLT